MEQEKEYSKKEPVKSKKSKAKKPKEERVYNTQVEPSVIPTPKPKKINPGGLRQRYTA